MNYSRRDLAVLMSAAATAAAAQDKAPAAKLSSKAFPFKDIEAKTTRAGKSRFVLQGALHQGFVVNCHITELTPGESPHPPHHHIHEEIVMLRDGTVDVTVDGATTRLESGSVWFIASNVEHGMKNVGTTNAIYFVVEFRGDGA